MPIAPICALRMQSPILPRFVIWTFPITQLSNKFSRDNGILSKLRHNVPMKSYRAYGCNIWLVISTDTNIKIIKMLLKKSIRVMTSLTLTANLISLLFEPTSSNVDEISILTLIQ